MDRVSLTAEYLAELAEGKPTTSELLGGLPENKILNSDKPNGRGQWLSRPLFLGREEHTRLAADLDHLLTALASLPERLFGGDFAAFARAGGLNEVQVAAVMSNRGATMTRQTRADMICDGEGFKLLELNIGSAVGGMDNVDVCRELLAHPTLSAFAERHGLTFRDSLREQVTNILVESGFTERDRPVVALTEWPTVFENEIPYMTQLCERWGELGLEAYPAHLGQLEVRDGRVWLRDRPVDIIVRTFLIRDVLAPDAELLTRPVFEAADRGEVKVFTPLDTTAYASKGALAMLSDERNRELFAPEVLESLDRILPWTRMVRPGTVTLEDGARVDLLTYAVEHREELVLKPTSLSGGKGVVLGWADEVTPERWREHLDEALGSPYVIQRRIRSVLESVPAEDGGLRRFRPVWGIVTGVNGFTGASVRAIPESSGDVVVNVAHGAHVGGVLHQVAQADPDPAA
ncbi:hypothetical protein [Streptomyces sp. NPDC048606]|uniref:hypothetical protein n=1 Tax=Streptomyces sp. NPDC048606 TaxID=3154726 RepID=UPI00344565A2